MAEKGKKSTKTRMKTMKTSNQFLTRRRAMRTRTPRRAYREDQPYFNEDVFDTYDLENPYSYEEDDWGEGEEDWSEEEGEEEEARPMRRRRRMHSHTRGASSRRGRLGVTQRRRLALTTEEVFDRSADNYQEAIDHLDNAIYSLKEILSELGLSVAVLTDPRKTAEQIDEVIQSHAFGGRVEEPLREFNTALRRCLEAHKRAVDLETEGTGLMGKRRLDTEEAMEFERSYFGR